MFPLFAIRQRLITNEALSECRQSAVGLSLVACGGVLSMGVEYNFQPLQVVDTKWRLGVRCTTDSDRSKKAGQAADLCTIPFEGRGDNT